MMVAKVERSIFCWLDFLSDRTFCWLDFLSDAIFVGSIFVWCEFFNQFFLFVEHSKDEFTEFQTLLKQKLRWQRVEYDNSVLFKLLHHKKLTPNIAAHVMSIIWMNTHQLCHRDLSNELLRIFCKSFLF